MMQTSPSFYITGGTLPTDAPSYIRRDADTALLEGLRQGEFCYVLTSRQMGKSSLMVRSAARLKAEGLAVAVLDLTGLGVNLSVEQWYRGLLGRVARQLGLEDELDTYWAQHREVGPLDRWVGALREVVLKWRPGKVVIFIDEIDVVRSLPFSTDEFFAAIRECYNRRVDDPEFRRLTFCLLGVAAPSDLIRDTRMTPFNIGQRIELHDFTELEAAPLANGLSGGGRDGEMLLRRILYWTGGHPYLTQRLCHEVAIEPTIRSVADIDRLCNRLFFTIRAREQDNNLLFVRDRLLRHEGDLASLLDLYAKVRSGKRVRDEETNPLVTVLRLSGVVSTQKGFLCIRNRIYARAFDRAWVLTTMPEAELRRQRTAYRRGLLQSSIAVGLLVIVISVLAFQVFFQSLRYNAQTHRLQYAARAAETDYGHALLNAGEPTGLLYLLEHGDIYEDLWLPYYRKYAGRLVNVIGGENGQIVEAAFSSGGKRLCTVTADGIVQTYDAMSGLSIGKPWKCDARDSLFSSDGHWLTTLDLSGGTVRRSVISLWNVATGQRIHTFTTDAYGQMSLSPDGRWLAITDHGGPPWILQVYETISGKPFGPQITGVTPIFLGSPFSPNGKRLALNRITDKGEVIPRVWDVATGQSWGLSMNSRANTTPTAICIHPDGRHLFIAAYEGAHQLSSIYLSDIIASKTKTLFTQPGRVSNLICSPDGRRLVAAIILPNPSGYYGTDWQLWDTGTARPIGPLLPGRKAILSPDGRYLAIIDGAIHIWDMTSPREQNVRGGAIWRSETRRTRLKEMLLRTWVALGKRRGKGKGVVDALHWSEWWKLVDTNKEEYNSWYRASIETLTGSEWRKYRDELRALEATTAQAKPIVKRHR